MKKKEEEKGKRQRIKWSRIKTEMHEDERENIKSNWWKRRRWRWNKDEGGKDLFSALWWAALLVY